jgi:formamidopyrimidine-DNA glycosylase
MPELPDILAYMEALDQRIMSQTLARVTIASPFLLRTFEPAISIAEGRKIVQLRRLGKRICIGLEEELWLILHLMIAGRLHWHEGASKPSRKSLATFQLSNGTLSLTEAGSKRRASLHVVERQSGLERLDPGGLEIFETGLEEFSRVLLSANHTLKRALTDPRLFSGIGNAYSDEILWEARLSPIALTQKLTAKEIERLFTATRSMLSNWIEVLRAEVGAGAFPEKVTAFRPGMAVHGRYQEPCPRCNAKVQRIRYASNETNYCPTCQTGGKLLADRSLSRLLRTDWPKTPEELEGLTGKG